MINYASLIKEKTTINPQTILEIGSRDADDANILRELFNIDSQNVYVVEPNPPQQLVISNKYPSINLIKKAIFNKAGKLKFNAVNIGDPGISSLLDRTDFYYAFNAHPIEVDAITGEELMKEINKEIDLCKIDVEGAAFEVLEGFQNEIIKIKSLHIECEHRPVWKNQKFYPQIKTYLQKNNFVQIYFHYVNDVPQQSDSIWVNANFLK